MCDMDKEKVSIVIPAYNVHNYIFRAIESSMKQTYQNIEIIIVDDGSSDGTWEVISRYQNADSRIRSFRQENAGVSSARNRAMDMSTGAYALFLDSDDWLEPQAVEMLVSLQRKNKNKLVATNRYRVFLDEKNNIRREKMKMEVNCAEFEKRDALLRVGSSKYGMTSACYKLFSMQIIHENGLQFDQAVRYGEDGLFVFEYLHFVDGLSYTNEPLWNILQRPGSAQRSEYNHSRMTAIDAVEKMIAIADDEQLRDVLRVYLVDRALTAEHRALESQSPPYDDIRSIREKNRQYMKLYLHKSRAFKGNIYCLSMTYAPMKLLHTYLQKRR